MVDSSNQQSFQHFLDTCIVESIFLGNQLESLQKSTLLKSSLAHFKVKGAKLPTEFPLMSMRTTDKLPSHTLKTSSLLPWGSC
jgi:hypothetical protein